MCLLRSSERLPLPTAIVLLSILVTAAIPSAAQHTTPEDWLKKAYYPLLRECLQNWKQSRLEKGEYVRRFLRSFPEDSLVYKSLERTKGPSQTPPALPDVFYMKEWGMYVASNPIMEGKVFAETKEDYLILVETTWLLEVLAQTDVSGFASLLFDQNLDESGNVLDAIFYAVAIGGLEDLADAHWWQNRQKWFAMSNAENPLYRLLAYRYGKKWTASEKTRYDLGLRGLREKNTIFRAFSIDLLRGTMPNSELKELVSSKRTRENDGTWFREEGYVPLDTYFEDL